MERDVCGSIATRFQPGQSGNPKGSSRRARGRRKLREALSKAVDQEVPDELLERLRDTLGIDLVGEAVADLIAARLIMLAFDPNKGGALNAIHEMIAVEPKEVELGPPPIEPEIPTDQEHLEALRAAMLETKNSGLPL